MAGAWPPSPPPASRSSRCKAEPAGRSRETRRSRPRDLLTRPASPWVPSLPPRKDFPQIAPLVHHARDHDFGAMNAVIDGIIANGMTLQSRTQVLSGFAHVRELRQQSKGVEDLVHPLICQVSALRFLVDVSSCLSEFPSRGRRYAKGSQRPVMRRTSSRMARTASSPESPSPRSSSARPTSIMARSSSFSASSSSRMSSASSASFRTSAAEW